MTKQAGLQKKYLNIGNDKKGGKKMRKEKYEGGPVSPRVTPPKTLSVKPKITICGDSKGVGTTGPGDCNGYKIEYVFPPGAETTCWSHEKLNISQCWQKSEGEGIKVAVLDTGIAYNHPDFCGNHNGRSECKALNASDDNQYKACKGCEHNAIIEYKDFTGSPFGAADLDGHGTHVAGIIAAKKNALGAVGVAPKAKLLIGKVLGDKRTGTHDQLANGINWAIDRGADIISMSLQSDIHDAAALKGNDPVHKAIKNAAKKGIIVICAAGNNMEKDTDLSPVTPDTVKYPSKYPETVSVGAIDREGRVPDFSCHGDQIDIVAPGDKILSSYPPDLTAVLSGTSMAAPFVSGVVALMLSDKKTEKKANLIGPGSTPEAMRDELIGRLKEEAIDVGPAGIDTASGFGLINPKKLLGLEGSRIQYLTDIDGKDELS